jgi:hypothetical protein
MDVEKFAKEIFTYAVTQSGNRWAFNNHEKIISWIEDKIRDAIAQDRKENTRPGHSPKELIIPGKGRADTLAANLERLREKYSIGQIEWHPNTGIVVATVGGRYHWICKDACGYGMGTPDWDEAVDAALEECDANT